MCSMQYEKEKRYIYTGILFHHQTFSAGNDEELSYRFDCPEFTELRNKYQLDTIAGAGTDFEKAKNLLHYLAPRLTHSSWYDNHVECNALKLLEYSLDNPQQGINCLNKSKILTECCLALGIYARRVIIMPFSPYDLDNHVVTEVFDRTLDKWIMLDCTTDGYFIDENRLPLSLLEMRDRFANDAFVTYVPSTEIAFDLEALREKYVAENTYICKNLFYLVAEQVSTFGAKNRQRLFFVPQTFSIKHTRIAATRFKLNHLPPEHEELKEMLKTFLEEDLVSEEPACTDIQSLLKRPF